MGRGGSVDGLVGRYRRLECDASRYREPLEVAEERGHVGRLLQVEHESCCRGLDALQRLDGGGRESSQERVAVVEAERTSAWSQSVGSRSQSVPGCRGFTVRSALLKT